VHATVRCFDDLVDEIRALPGVVRLVGIDGHGGAGKTTFAGRLSRAADDCAVIHTDDFASHDNALDWWPRLLAEVVEPLTRREPARFRPYDWVERRLAAEVVVEPQPIVLIEGVSATREAWRERLAHRIWIETPRDLCLHRGLERDGADMAEFWQWWLASEDAYIAREQPQQRADLIVDGNPAVAHDPEREFVSLPRVSGPSATAADAVRR
jgi:uridine kinase